MSSALTFFNSLAAPTKVYALLLILSVLATAFGPAPSLQGDMRKYKHYFGNKKLALYQLLTGLVWLYLIQWLAISGHSTIAWLLTLAGPILIVVALVAVLGEHLYDEYKQDRRDHDE